MELGDSETQTLKQEDFIMQVFEGSNGAAIADQIYLACKSLGKNWPITSIRRAISTLTKAGKLTKTNELRMGRHGKKTHVWRINEQTT